MLSIIPSEFAGINPEKHRIPRRIIDKTGDAVSIDF